MRACDSCTACCWIAEIHGHDFVKPAHSTCPHVIAGGGCRIHEDPTYPKDCKSFKCLWLSGLGEINQRPDLSGVMLSINTLNGGTWIFAIEGKPDALTTSAKNIVLEAVKTIDIPMIVVDYASKPPTYGDRVVVKDSLAKRARRLMGPHVTALSPEVNVYKLIR